MKISRIIMMLAALMLANITVKAETSRFADESLDYVVTYKWGLIQKDAGEAQLSLRNYGSEYRLSLTARTKPWADKIYKVRDTLTCRVHAEGFKPIEYVKTTHEEEKYALDVIRYTYDGQTVIGNATRTRERKSGLETTEKVLEATGPTYDMLSTFYYVRLIDYSSLQPGQTVVATVFSGTKVETITLRAEGIETITCRNKTKAEAWHIKFRFTTEGKRSSDDIDVWISNDESRIPLLLEGQLKIGKIRVLYTQP